MVRWLNVHRRINPVRFWFGLMLPITLLMMYAGLAIIALAVKSGWLQ